MYDYTLALKTYDGHHDDIVAVEASNFEKAKATWMKLQGYSEIGKSNSVVCIDTNDPKVEIKRLSE